MSRRGQTNGVFTEDAAARETRHILWIVLWLNLGVAAAKFGYGFLTGSVSMQADGIHSSFDGLSNVIGLIGLWAAAHPPDACTRTAARSTRPLLRLRLDWCCSGPASTFFGTATSTGASPSCRW